MKRSRELGGLFVRDTSTGGLTAATAKTYEEGVFQTLFLVEQVTPAKATASLELDFAGETKSLHVEVVDGVFVVLSVWDNGILVQNLLNNEYEVPSRDGGQATKRVIGVTEIEAIKRQVVRILVASFPDMTS